MFAWEIIAKDRGAKICSSTLDGIFSFETGRWLCERRAGIWERATQFELSEIAESPHWKLYEEPAEDVEVFEWMTKVDKTWLVSDYLRTEKEAHEYYERGGEEYRKTGRSWKVPAK